MFFKLWKRLGQCLVVDDFIPGFGEVLQHEVRVGYIIRRTVVDDVVGFAEFCIRGHFDRTDFITDSRHFNSPYAAVGRVTSQKLQPCLMIPRLWCQRVWAAVPAMRAQCPFSAFLRPCLRPRAVIRPLSTEM